MPRMPGPYDLGGIPSARSGRQIAQFDTTAYGEGLARFGASIADAGNTLEASFERTRSMRDKATELNAQKSFLEFKANEDKVYQDATRGMKPDEAVGFSDRYRSGYKERADEFARKSLALLEPETRAKYDRQLYAIEDNNYSSALDYEQKEIGRQSESAAQSTLNNIIMPKVASAAKLPADDPRKAGYLKEAETEFFSLIDARPDKTEIEKAQLKEDARGLIQKGFALSLPPEERVTLDPTYSRKGLSSGNATLDEAREAIAAIESSGRYNAVGPVTNRGDRAYGRYQVMGANIPSWTKAALGYSMTPQQFINDPAAQDAVFHHQFGSYIEKYGNADDAASVWFTGRPMSQGANARDVTGTSGSEYVRRFRGALGKEVPRETGWAVQLDAIPYEDRVKIAEGAEVELVRLERELDKTEVASVVKEGDDLLFDDELTNDWVEANKDELSPTNYRRFKRALQPSAGGSKEDPREYLRIEDMVENDPEEAMEEARDAYVAGRIGKSSYNTIRSRAKQAMGEEPENKTQQSPFVKSIRKNVSTKLKPRSNAHESEFVRQVEALEAFDDWAEKNPKASEVEVRKFADNLINETNRQRTDLGKRGLSLPRYLPAVIRPEAVTKQDLEQAMVRTNEAMNNGLISRRQFQDEAVLLYRWMELVGEEAP